MIRIVLYEPKYEINLGSVYRLGGCFGVDGIVACNDGYAKKIKESDLSADTAKCRRTIPLERTGDILQWLKQNRTKDERIVVVEKLEGQATMPLFCHPENAIYVFGGESRTVPKEIIEYADYAVSIDMAKPVYCLNLAMAVAITLYDRSAKICKEGLTN